MLRLTSPLGIPTDTALIALSGVFMTATLGLSYRLFRVMGEDERTSRWALFVLLFAGCFLQQSTEAEVYGLQMVLTLSAYLAYLRDRPWRAGILLGLATLTTPLGALIAGFFAAEAIRTRRWKPFAITSVVGAALFFAVLAFDWRDYFYGTRGLLIDQRNVQTIGKGLENAVAVVKNLHFMLPFLIAGLMIAWRRDRRWLWLLVGLTLSHLPAILTVTEDGVFELPIYPVIAALIALGVVAGLSRPGTVRTATGLALALYVAASLLIWLDPYDQRVKDGMLEGVRRVPPGAVLISNWSFVKTIEFYSGAPRDTLVASRRLLWPERLPDIAAALRSGQPVYLMEPHLPTRGVRWLFTPTMQARHYAQNALMPRLERMLGVKGAPFFSRRGGPIFYRVTP